MATIFGIHAVQAVLKRQANAVKVLYVSQGRINPRLADLVAQAEAGHIAVQRISDEAMDKKADGALHQGVIAEATVEQKNLDLISFVQALPEPAFLLILDTIQDPHNLGACLRTADAAGVHAVIAPKDKSVGITPVVRKVACGADQSVPFFAVTNLARTLDELKALGIWVYGTTADAPASLYQQAFTGNIALVMGNEGEGMRRLTQEKCDVLFNIPMHGSVESLNVSVATAVCLYEVVRQRR